MDKLQPGFFQDTRVAIVGLGLMGGSLALALKDRCASVLGIDPDPSAVKLAVENRIVDLASGDPASLLPTADLIILAAPVRTIITLLGEIPAHHPSPAIVIDLGSTKGEILKAMAKLPDRFDPIGGHPICGKEQSSLAFADGRLYQDAPFVLTPLERTSPRARLTAAQLALTVGARPLWMDAADHDRRLAATSHFPYLLANALAATTPLEAAPLTGPGFQSMTRLAASSQEMMRDILMTNSGNVLVALRAFQNHLARMEDLLQAEDFERLSRLLKEGAENKENIYASKGALL